MMVYFVLVGVLCRRDDEMNFDILPLKVAVFRKANRRIKF